MAGQDEDGEQSDGRSKKTIIHEVFHRWKANQTYRGASAWPMREST